MRDESKPFFEGDGLLALLGNLVFGAITILFAIGYGFLAFMLLRPIVVFLWLTICGK